jgi:Tfp pilus assembly protein FimT
MIVIVIMGILAAVSVPGLAKIMQSWRLGGETDKFAGALLRARSAAVTRNTVSVFKFKMSDGTYFYFEDTDGDGQRDSDEYQSETHTMTAGISIAEHTLSGPILIFGPRGNANQSGIVTLGNSRGQQRTVSVFGGTGNIKTN